MQVKPEATTAPQTKAESLEFFHRPLHLSTASTLATCRKSNTTCLGLICSALLTPCMLVGRFFGWVASCLQNVLFGCCHYREVEEKIDWQEVKKIFAPLQTSDADSIQKTFNEVWRALSEPVKVKFREYVGFAIAEIEHNKMTRQDQEAWLQDNFPKIEFPSYLNSVANSPVVTPAIVNFQKEIDRNCKS